MAISEQLQKKIDFAINLLQHIPSEDIEIAFSGGKDSSVILHLCKLAGIMDKCTPIYKNTTIDPSGNIAFCKSQGCEIIQPKKTFFRLIRERGFPTRRARFCCDVLKEYKIKDNVVIGVRKDESTVRQARYSEPQICRAYGNNNKPKRDRSNVTKQYLPILEWDNCDVYDFLEHYKVDVNPYYTDSCGEGLYLDVEKRLGCECCPMQGQKKLIAHFKAKPRMVRAYIRNGLIWWNKPREKEISSKRKFGTIYDLFYHNVFCNNYADYIKKTGKGGLFEPLDCKKFLEEYFNIKLP